MSPILERAALHQTRFRTPGIAPDSRGVVLGSKGALLFSSLDRVVAFFRAYGDEGALDEVLPTLAIRRVVSPLRTKEVLVTLAAESSYRMDRVAAVARLAGGEAFTGTTRHFVKYRDASAPLGYDVVSLTESNSDVTLHHDAWRQAYAFDGEIPFRDLVLKLQPFSIPPRERTTPTRVLVSAEVGLGHAIIGYLFRWRVKASVGLAEWPSESAFDDRPRRLHVLDIDDPPPRVLGLLRSLPGVTVYEPVGRKFAVELGFRHPISLEACASLFAENSLTMFRGDGTVVMLDPLPPFSPVRTLVRAELAEASARNIEALVPASVQVQLVDIALRLAPTLAPPRRVVASIVPIEEREWLSKMLYLLPSQTLGSLRMAITENAIFLVDQRGIETVPLGRFYSEVADRIYVPAGMTLVPAVSPSVLSELVSDRGTGHAFFQPGEDQPRLIAADAFGPVSRTVLRDIGGKLVHADAPDRHDPTLPLVAYGPETSFPLWGVVGQTEETKD
jgi:hypothetical protein